MPYIETPSKTKWFHRINGKGKTLLFIHGWSFDSNIWFRQIDNFGNCRVVTLDLPGHGSSDYKKDIDIIKELEFIVKRLELNNLNLIGHSLGGLLALKFTLRYPELVNRTVLICSTAKFVKADGYQQGLDENDVNRLRGFLTQEYPGILLAFIRWLFTKDERKQSDFRKIWSIISKRPKWPNKEALGEFLSVIEREDLRKELKNLNVPTLIISGTDDPICPRASAEYLNRQIGDSRLELFDGCGHLPFLTQAKKFNELVHNFLK